MSDDHSHRPFRANEMPRRQAPSGSGAGTPSGSDPLAELARLIGQTDPFGEYGRKSASAPSQPGPAMPEPTRAHQRAYVPPAQDQELAQAYRSAQSYGATENVDRTGAHGHDDYARPAHESAPPPAAHGHDSRYGDEPAGYEYDSYDPNDATFEPDGSGYYDETKPRRRSGVLAVAAVFTLAVIGTAGALGYRTLFGRVTSGPPPIIKADPRPSKIVPDKKDTASAKLINDRVGSGVGVEKLVPREEQPVEIKPAGAFPGAAQASPGARPAQAAPGQAVAAGAMPPPTLGSGVIGGEPKKIHTIVIHPDRTAMAGPLAVPLPVPPLQPPAPPARSPRAAHPSTSPEAAPPQHASPRAGHVARISPKANAPLSLDPNVGARTASVAAAPTTIKPHPAAGSSGKFAVQLSSRRSQSEAEAAFRSLKAKFPSQLGSRQSIIRKVDLGKKGVYFRTMVGPFATSDEASKLCSSLKAAGGSCFVQRI